MTVSIIGISSCLFPLFQSPVAQPIDTELTHKFNNSNANQTRSPHQLGNQMAINSARQNVQRCSLFSIFFFRFTRSGFESSNEWILVTEKWIMNIPTRKWRLILVDTGLGIVIVTDQIFRFNQLAQQNKNWSWRTSISEKNTICFYLFVFSQGRTYYGSVHAWATPLGNTLSLVSMTFLFSWLWYNFKQKKYAISIG